MYEDEKEVIVKVTQSHLRSLFLLNTGHSEVHVEIHPRVIISVLKCHHQKQAKERTVNLAYLFLSLLIIKGSQDMNSSTIRICR